MLAINRPKGVAPEVSLWKMQSKRSTPDYTQGRYHQKSKTGVSVALQKELMFSIISLPSIHVVKYAWWSMFSHHFIKLLKRVIN